MKYIVTIIVETTRSADELAGRLAEVIVHEDALNAGDDEVQDSKAGDEVAQRAHEDRELFDPRMRAFQKVSIFLGGLDDGRGFRRGIGHARS